MILSPMSSLEMNTHGLLFSTYVDHMEAQVSVKALNILK